MLHLPLLPLLLSGSAWAQSLQDRLRALDDLKPGASLPRQLPLQPEPPQLPAQLRPDPILTCSKQPPQRFDQSLDELVRQGVVSPGERRLIRSGALAQDECRSGSDPQPLDSSPFQQACRSGALSPQECRGGVAIRWGRRQSGGLGSAVPTAGIAAPPLSPAALELLQKMRQEPTWRRYGQCQYDWSGWKLHDNGTRTTAADCGGTAMRWIVGVSCNRLLVATRGRDGQWNSWERPAGPDSKFRQGEDEMVATLCANITAPATTPAPTAKEVEP